VYIFSGGLLKVPSGIPDSPQVWVEAWVYPQPPTSGGRTVLSKAGGYSLQLTNGFVNFTVTTANGTSSVTSNMTVTNGVWTHVGGWYNGLKTVVEVNGTVTVTPFTGGPVVPSVYMGANDDAGTQYFSGSIDEVRIRTVAPFP
jgi:hypothetical protein